MYKKIIGILITTLLISTGIPVMGFQETLDELDQYYTPNSYYSDQAIYEGMAQTFKPNMNKLTRVQLLLYKETALVPIYNYYRIRLYDGNPVTGDDTVISQKVINFDSIPAGMNWVEVDLPDATVIPGDLYSISICGEEFVMWGSAHLYWAFYNDGYPKGDAYYYNHSSESWKVFKLFGQFWDNCFKTYGIKETNNPPNKPDQASGTTNPRIGKESSWSSRTTDPDGDQIFYKFIWGDGDESIWMGPFISGETVFAKHTYSEIGNFNIFVKAQDIYGAESEISDGITVHPHRSKSRDFQIGYYLHELINCFPFFEKVLKQHYYL